MSDNKKGTKTEVHIVVVDYSEISRKKIVEILTENKFDVVGQAKSAEEAVQFFSGSGANLFIVDLLMPEISGLDLIKMMSEKMLGIHIIMMSSVESNHLVIDSFLNGAFDFLQKPIISKDLIKSVQKIQNLIEKDD